MLAPWITENPIMMHVLGHDRRTVRVAVDQCAEVGFEMAIITFWSGFEQESEDPAYLPTCLTRIERAVAAVVRRYPGACA